jgi:flagellar hook-associated protein 2
VQRLAGVDRWAFDGVADADVDLATADGQQLAFDVGGTSYSIAVDQADSSLNELATAINDAAGADVHASVVNTGTQSSPQYQLVLASKDSGADARITNIASGIAGLSITYSPPDAQGAATSASNVTVGNNAVAVLDGLTITRASNDFSDVYEGVTLDVQAVTAGEVSFTIEPDRAAVRAKIDEFVSAYNDVIGFINTQNTFTPSDEDGEPGTSGVLFGDSVLTTVRRGLRSALFDVDVASVLADTTGFVTLNQLGIEQGSDGTLSIDDAKFDAKLSEDIGLFADLFVDLDGFERDPLAEPNTPEYYTDISADSGLMASLVREIERMFGSLPDDNEAIELRGIFDLKRDTISDQIKRFNDQIEARERRLDDYEETLVLRFARLEELMGALNAQGAALVNALNQFQS